MSGVWLVLAPALAPAIGGVAALLLSARPGGRPAAATACALAGLVAGLVAAAVLWRACGGAALVHFDGALLGDRFGLAIAGLVLACAIVSTLAATDVLARRGLALGECHALTAFAASGAVVMVMAGDLLTLFLGLEVMSVAAYVLTASHRTNPRGVEGAAKYFLLGAFASGFLLYGIACAYGATGSLRFAPLQPALAGGGAPHALAKVAGALLLVGLAFKVGAAPFHQWVPDAYDGAPTPVTAFMATAIKAAAVAALLRVLVGAFQGPEAGAVLQVLAGATMAVGNLLALSQRNVKRLLAYSSVAHAGYALVGVAAAADPGWSTDAVSAVMVYLVTYAVSALGAFIALAALERADGAPLELVDCRGLAARHPALAAILTLCLLSLAGLPPLAGFLGKYLVFLVALDAGMFPLALLGIAMSLVGLGYYLRIPLLLYLGKEDAPRPTGEVPAAASGWLRMALGLSVAATVWFGAGPSLRGIGIYGVSDLLRWASASARDLY